MCDQFILAQSLARLSHDASSDKFAPLRIRYAKELPASRTAGCPVDGSLHLARIDIFAARHDHVLEAIQDIKISVCIPVADVSGAKEAVSERASLVSASRIIPA